MLAFVTFFRLIVMIAVHARLWASFKILWNGVLAISTYIQVSFRNIKTTHICVDEAFHLYAPAFSTAPLAGWQLSDISLHFSEFHQSHSSRPSVIKYQKLTFSSGLAPPPPSSAVCSTVGITVHHFKDLVTVRRLKLTSGLITVFTPHRVFLT